MYSKFLCKTHHSVASAIFSPFDKMFPLFAVVTKYQCNENRMFLPLNVQSILDDQTPPVVPRKHSASVETKGKALPNTYVERKESNNKGEALSADCITPVSHILATFKG